MGNCDDSNSGLRRVVNLLIVHSFRYCWIGFRNVEFVGGLLLLLCCSVFSVRDWCMYFVFDTVHSESSSVFYQHLKVFISFLTPIDYIISSHIHILKEKKLINNFYN